MLNSLQKWYNKMGQKFKNFNISPLLVFSYIVELKTSPILKYNRIMDSILKKFCNNVINIILFQLNT